MKLLRDALIFTVSALIPFFACPHSLMAQNPDATEASESAAG